MNHVHVSDSRGAMPRDERGSATVETVLMMPLLVIFLLMFAALHRGADARALIDAAAGQAARAATLGPDTTAQTRALETAEATLAGSRDCPAPSIDVYEDTAALGGSETVHITCHVPLADLALPDMPGHLTLTGTATSPRDPFSQER